MRYKSFIKILEMGMIKNWTTTLMSSLFYVIFSSPKPGTGELRDTCRMATMFQVLCEVLCENTLPWWT